MCIGYNQFMTMYALFQPKHATIVWTAQIYWPPSFLKIDINDICELKKTVTLEHGFVLWSSNVDEAACNLAKKSTPWRFRQNRIRQILKRNQKSFHENVVRNK